MAGAVVFVLIVVVLLVAAFAVQSLRTAGSSAPSSEVAVAITGVDWVFNGATNCWSSLTDPSTYSLLGGQQFTTTWVLDYNAGWFQPSTCTITSVSVQTVGFSLVSDNVPFVVRSGGSQTISVTVSTPGTAFTGVLTLDATVTSP